MEQRDRVSPSEERLLKILGPISDFANLLKRISNTPLMLSQVMAIGGTGGG